MGWLSRILSSGRSPEPEVLGDPLRIAEVETVLAELRPAFVADGGDIRVRQVDEDGVVSLELVGACSHCGVSDMTLYGAIEPRLRERLSWVTRVRTGSA